MIDVCVGCLGEKKTQFNCYLILGKCYNVVTSSKLCVSRGAVNASVKPVNFCHCWVTESSPQMTPSLHCLSEQWRLAGAGKFTTYRPWLDNWKLFFYENFNLNKHSRVPPLGPPRKFMIWFNGLWQPSQWTSRKKVPHPTLIAGNPVLMCSLRLDLCFNNKLSLLGRTLLATGHFLRARALHYNCTKSCIQEPYSGTIVAKKNETERADKIANR